MLYSRWKDIKDVYIYYLINEIYNDQNSIKEIITNYDQLSNLKWKGEENETKQKIAFWNAYWGKQILELNGLYGRKQYFWIEPCSNYSIQLQIVYAGSGKQKRKIQKNLLQYNFQIILSGGGNNNELGVKEGQWIELCDEILPQQNQFIIDIGKYKGGHKVGCQKKFIYEDSILTKNKLIRGGEFQLEIKNGKWIQRVIIVCQQNKQRILRNFCWLLLTWIKEWSIHIKEQNEQQLTIGGTYDNLGQKNECWSELSNSFHQSHFTIFNGYYKNGIKYGKWTRIKEWRLD
ncbi:unnamed protein product [Paramecium pentaurelia]|uniref:Uncharacterized protein n=1 Tax=Paramecium pentaurelia TaxID=43138 RepID=A0A8S1UWB7_9CILI|nr:unnamed protein product [Paramecium pentaurelia]